MELPVSMYIPYLAVSIGGLLATTLEIESDLFGEKITGPRITRGNSPSGDGPILLSPWFWF